MMLSPDLPEADKHELFIRFRAMSSIVHPNVSTVYSLENIDGRPAGVMEHIGGSFLDDIIQAEAPLDALRAAGLARQIVSGLDAIHEAGIVHKDIRPANAVINARGILKIINFTQAFLVKRACGPAPRLMDGLLDKLRWLNPASDPLVELSYTAPEQLRGGPITPQTDLYGVGAILYHMLSGKRPFVASSLYDLMHAITEVEPERLEMRSSLEAELAAIAIRCLAKSPGDRFESAASLVSALDDIELRLQAATLSTAGIAATQIAPPRRGASAKPAAPTPASASAGGSRRRPRPSQSRPLGTVCPCRATLSTAATGSTRFTGGAAWAPSTEQPTSTWIARSPSRFSTRSS